ncbi:hypothetical protein C8F04DRAFT_1365203 [Mycena alexandri]|uniref:Uncharacterized protein n=1 Tax=Mycena alexandri TaxID=1745969 RepID=A0AAD6SN20_9AGAR|nr:hypothetical protein C8F04DRAFT_1365203 [Mycena alexandri]
MTAVSHVVPPLPTTTLRLDPIEERLQRDAEEEEAQDRQQDEQLRRILASAPLMSELFTPEEEADFAEAIRQSNASFMSTLSTPSPSASLAAGPSTSRSTTSSTSHSAATRTSTLRPVYPAGKEPETRTTVNPARPKITTQMSATWMRKYRDDTAADAAAIKRGTFTPIFDIFDIYHYLPSTHSGPINLRRRAVVALDHCHQPPSSRRPATAKVPPGAKIQRKLEKGIPVFP